jgi:hypothetical protein
MIPEEIKNSSAPAAPCNIMKWKKAPSAVSPRRSTMPILYFRMKNMPENRNTGRLLRRPVFRLAAKTNPRQSAGRGYSRRNWKPPLKRPVILCRWCSTAAWNTNFSCRSRRRCPLGGDHRAQFAGTFRRRRQHYRLLPRYRLSQSGRGTVAKQQLMFVRRSLNSPPQEAAHV